MLHKHLIFLNIFHKNLRDHHDVYICINFCFNRKQLTLICFTMCVLYFWILVSFNCLRPWVRWNRLIDCGVRSVENAECRKWRVWKKKLLKNCSNSQDTQVTTLGVVKLNRVYKCFVYVNQV